MVRLRKMATEVPMARATKTVTAMAQLSARFAACNSSLFLANSATTESAKPSRDFLTAILAGVTSLAFSLPARITASRSPLATLLMAASSVERSQGRCFFDVLQSVTILGRPFRRQFVQLGDIFSTELQAVSVRLLRFLPQGPVGSRENGLATLDLGIVQIALQHSRDFDRGKRISMAASSLARMLAERT